MRIRTRAALIAGLSAVAAVSLAATIAGEGSGFRSAFAPVSPRAAHAGAQEGECLRCHPAQGRPGPAGETPRVYPPESEWAH